MTSPDTPPDLGSRLERLAGLDPSVELRHVEATDDWFVLFTCGDGVDRGFGGPTPNAAVSSLEAFDARMTPLPVSDGKTVRLPLPTGPLPHPSPDIVPPLPVVVEPDDALVALVDAAREALSWIPTCGYPRCSAAPCVTKARLLAALAPFDNPKEEDPHG